MVAHSLFPSFSLWGKESETSQRLLPGEHRAELATGQLPTRVLECVFLEELPTSLLPRTLHGTDHRSGRSWVVEAFSSEALGSERSPGGGVSVSVFTVRGLWPGRLACGGGEPGPTIITWAVPSRKGAPSLSPSGPALQSSVTLVTSRSSLNTASFRKGWTQPFEILPFLLINSLG